MGSYRSYPQKTKTTYQMSSLDHSYASVHMCGWRKYMQDANLTISPFTYKNYSLFCVFDGHGGPEVALFARKHFPLELQKNQNLKKGRFQLALKQTFLRIDILLMSQKGRRQIKQLKQQQILIGNSPSRQSLNRIGCTSLVVLVTKQYLYVANAGDSRAVGSNHRGECITLSNDHKPYNKIEQIRIKRAGGYIEFGRVNGCLNLSRALGDLQFKQNQDLNLQQQIITSCPQVIKYGRKGLNFVIMGCDGIWQQKSSEAMCIWVRQRMKCEYKLGKILQNLLDQLIAENSRSQTGTDNMSAILIKFD